MDKIRYRAVIQFLVLEKIKAKAIHARMLAVYGDTAPKYSTVTKWASLFKHGRTSLEDDERCGGPNKAIVDENIDAVRAIVMADRRVTTERLEHEVGISHGSIIKILHKYLNLKKVSARWVPKMLSEFDKERRRDMSNDLLQQYREDPELFEKRIVTMDETWIYHYDPESKQESMAWKTPDEPAPKKFKTVKSAGKVLLSVFWDCKGVIMAHYVPHKVTITGEYHSQLLRRLRECIKEERRGKIRAGILLQQDNAPVHTCHVATAAALECGYELLPHPAYSPDLAPSDYHLFSNLKKYLRGRHFHDDEEAKNCVENWLSEQEENFYLIGIRKLQERWEKCIEVHGDYVEK